MSMKTGTVDKIIVDKGYGFIKSGSIRYFFHTSECITDFEALKEGDEVKFENVLSDKGPRATEVERT